MRNAKHTPNHETASCFVSYLEGTLIPDLEESGSTGHVEDYRDAIHWIRQAHEENATDAAPKKKKAKRIPNGNAEVEIVDCAPIYIAIGPFCWGKGFTVKQAKELMCANGTPENARRNYIVYCTKDPTAYVNNFGSVCWHKPFTCKVVEGKRDGKRLPVTADDFARLSQRKLDALDRQLLDFTYDVRYSCGALTTGEMETA